MMSVIVLVGCSKEEETTIIASGSSHYDDSSLISDKSSASNGNSESSFNSESNSSSDIEDSEEIERKNKEQLMAYEATIEETLKNALNSHFQEDVVLNVDIKTFGVDSTLLANGYISFVDGVTKYATSLGVSLDDDILLELSSIADLEVDQTKDLAENYGINELKSITDFITSENLSFSYAKLNGENWDLDYFTATQVEHYLEAKVTNMVQQYFTENYSKPYLENADLKYLEATWDINYGGDILKIRGTMQSIKTANVMPFYVTLRMADEDFINISALLNEQVDTEKDLAQNYSFNVLNTVKGILEKDTTYVVKYTVDGATYVVKD